MIERFGHDKIRLVECPVCGRDLRDKKVSFHVESHAPTDFGLSPQGVIQ
jgi:Zn ribbon nucleic-acid-binding protein